MLFSFFCYKFEFEEVAMPTAADIFEDEDIKMGEVVEEMHIENDEEEENKTTEEQGDDRSPVILRKKSINKEEEWEKDIKGMPGTDIILTLSQYGSLPPLNVTEILVQSRGDAELPEKMSKNRRYPKKTAATSFIYWWKSTLTVEVARYAWNKQYNWTSEPAKKYLLLQDVPPLLMQLLMQQHIMIYVHKKNTIWYY